MIMIRKLFLTILSLLAVCSVRAQQPDLLRQLSAHPEYLDGTDYLCPADATDLTPAPEGYEAFYISHYGRHGARYAWQSDLYTRLESVLRKAGNKENLTPLGVDYKDRFDRLYPSVYHRTGDLSRKGFRQQEALAARMYANNPEVFGDGAAVRAWTSTSTRCVMTMSAFCLGLKAANPQLDIFEHFGKYYLPAILPLDGSNPFRQGKMTQTPLAFDETWEQYIARTVDYKAILSRLFKEPDKALEPKEQWDFVSYLYFFAAGMASLDTDLVFTDLFTPEERIALYRIDNFQFYANAWPTHLGYLPIVDDLVAKAQERIDRDEKGADLRFGHDYTFLPLLMCLGVNGYDRRAVSGDDIENICRLQDVPMGANLHFVFYRSKTSDRILFKVLLNGREARLPIAAVNGPYYDWETFKRAQAYRPVMGEVETVRTTAPEVSGVCPSPDGKGLLVASDEDGIYQVSLSGETLPFYIEDGMDCEAVTIDPKTRDVYYVVEGKQEVRRLKAPKYKKSELLYVLKDAGYGTNSGLEGLTWYQDGTLLVGNQDSPNLLVTYSLKKGEISRRVLTDTKEIADLCYDPVRDVLWIADSDARTINLCTLEGDVLKSFPVPFIDNGEGLYVDHENQCIWVGDDTTSKLYKIHFSNL